MAPATLIPSASTRQLARELGSIRRDIERIKEGNRTTQLGASSLMYPMIIRDPLTGEVIGSFGPNGGSASLIPIGGTPPPAPTNPTLEPLMQGILVGWDGKFIDDTYVPPPLLAGPVRLLAAPSGKVGAAGLILDRLKSGQPIFEDWTWNGAPAVVGTWNDELLADAEASGLSGDNWPFSAGARDWLQGFLDDAETEAQEPEPGTLPPGADSDGSGGQLTPDTPEKIAAATVLLDRFRQGRPVAADWTFSGMPDYVATHGPVLHSEWYNRGTPQEYLQYYVTSRSARPHNFGYVGIHVGTTQDFITDPSNLVGVLPTAGTFPVTPVYGETWVRLVGYNNSTPPVSGPASDTVSATPNQVVSTAVLDGIVTEVALADLAVSTRTVQLAAIQAQLLAAAAVTAPALAPAAVTGPAIASAAVTADAIAANSIRAGSLEAASVTAAALAAGSVGANAILANSIGAAQIAAAAIDASHLRAGAVTAGALAASSVTAGAMAANSVTAGALTAGAVTADKLAALLVVANRMVAGDPVGSRAEINNGGIFGFAGSLRTFSLRSDGTAYLNGTIEAGSGNDRLVIQPAGSGRPEIHFFALPTGPAYINAVPVQINAAATDGVGIGVNSGPRPSPFPNRQTTMLVRPDRASLAYTQVGTGAARGGESYVDALTVDMAVWSDAGVLQQRVRLRAEGLVSTGSITAPSFPVSSDARVKTAPRDVDDWDPFAALKGRIGRWRYLELEPDQDHLGPVDARDLPEWMHRTHPEPGNDSITLNLADLVGVALLMADRLDDRVRVLESAARVA